MNFRILYATLTMIVPLGADTVFTIPQGYTKINIAAADSVGTTKLTAISASLLQDISFAGTAALGAFDSGAGTQVVNISGVTWTSNQWASTPPFMAYLSVADDVDNADGIAPAEEAFLIRANTVSGGLTLETSFDLTVRFPANSAIKIREANTLDSFFGTSSASFGGNDIVYLWSGSDWDSFQYVGGQWTTIDDPFTDVGATTLVHPDEGIFVSRAEITPIVVTLFGEVPSAPQIATITGVSFVSSRFPIATTLIDMGIATPNWTGNDVLYIWNQAASPAPAWDSYQYNGGQWTTVDDPFTSVNDTLIPANSALFVSRAIPVQSEDGGTTATLPYAID